MRAPPSMVATLSATRDRVAAVALAISATTSLAGSLDGSRPVAGHAVVVDDDARAVLRHEKCDATTDAAASAPVTTATRPSSIFAT